LYDDRVCAILTGVPAAELHAEITEWMDTLDESEWDRVVIAIDRLATLGENGADAVLTCARTRTVRAAVHARARHAADDCARLNP
jgi:hypothetical protein